MGTGTRVVLDAQQQEAVDFDGRRLKLLGAPGTGKTTVLKERALRLIGEGVDPAAILFFVQDRRQAIDLRDALVRDVGRSVARPSVLTFHAFCWSLLTQAIPVTDPQETVAEIGFQLAGLAAEPVLLTAFDQRAFVRNLLREEDPSDWPVNGGLLHSPAFAGEVRDFLLRAQERLETPETLRALARERGRPDWDELASFFRRYLMRIEDPDTFEDGRPRLDFALVLTEARRVLGEHPDLHDDIRRLYPHVLADDFEEANRAEMAILEALLPGDGEVDRTAVIAGDLTGSVFSFRGADPSCLQELPAPEIVLERVYRRAVAPEVRLYSHVTDEARGIVAELRAAGTEGTSWGDMAVVMRDFRGLLGPLRRELNRAGIAYRVDGESIQLAQDPVVRPVLFLFTIACKRTGHEELWPALLTSELGGFAAHELVQLRRAARLAGVALHELCANESSVVLPVPVRQKLDQLCALVGDAHRWAAELRPDDCFWQLWNTSSWFRSLVEQEDHRRLDSLTTLADALARHTERRGSEARMADFIDTLASADFAPESVRLDKAEDAVTVTTAHAAKGREFAFTVVAGCVEGMWPDPSRRGLLLDVDLLVGPKDHADRQREALAEEERLFTLAVSRSEHLVLTGQRAGGSERSSAEPSRFLESFIGELPENNAEVRSLVRTPREAENLWRGTLAHADAPPEERLAALWGLARLAGVAPERWWWGRRWTENPMPVVGELKQSSYSRFSNYENCPLQYLLGQVLGLDPTTSYHMAFGSLIHGLLEDLEAGRLPKDLDALVAEAERRWRPEAYPPGAVSDFLKRDCREILARYLEFEAANGHQTLGVEEWFEFDVNGWLVRGKIDRIDRVVGEGLRLCDYKTSNSWKRDNDVAEDLQLSTYLLACVRDERLKAMGVPKAAELIFVRHAYNGKINRAQMLRPRDPDDGRTWDAVIEERIAGLLSGIEAEEFAPSPDAECRNCSFQSLCPMWPEGEELTVR
ncbi:MAG: ATP-dependent helicase [Actinomycetota bacterium]|nr:ATP-dependent helicase [Actinomycetota bacterium]